MQISGKLQMDGVLRIKGSFQMTSFRKLLTNILTVQLQSKTVKKC